MTTIKATIHKKGNVINNVPKRIPIIISKSVNEATEIARRTLIVNAPYRKYGTGKSKLSTKPRKHRMHIKKYLENRSLCTQKTRTVDMISGAIIFNDELVPQARWVSKGTNVHPIPARRGKRLSFWWSKKGIWFRGPIVNQGITNPNDFIRRSYVKSKLEIIRTFKKNMKLMVTIK